MIVADSRNKISIDLKGEAGAHGGEDAVHSLKDYLPSVDTISKDAAFTGILAAMKSGRGGHGAFDLNGETHYLVYRQLSTFNWSVAQLKSYSELLEGKSSLGKIKQTILITVIVTLAIAIAVIFIVSDRITKPLLHLTDAVKEIAGGNLNVKLPEIRSKDEIADLNAAMRKMVGNQGDSERRRAPPKVTEASSKYRPTPTRCPRDVQTGREGSQIATASEEMSYDNRDSQQHLPSPPRRRASSTKMARRSSRGR